MPSKEAVEAVDDRLVVHEDVHRVFRGGHQVEEGEGLGPLGGLGKAMDAGGVVESVIRAVVDAEPRSGQEEEEEARRKADLSLDVSGGHSRAALIGRAQPCPLPLTPPAEP